MTHNQDYPLQDQINTAKAKAYGAFLEAVAKFDEHVCELQDMSDEQMGTSDDEILWEATAMVNRYNALLAQITDSYHKRGEYAP